jgi:hypothetical protein
MTATIGKALDERVNEGGAGRGKALLAATIIGFGAAVATYKALRNS